MEPWQRIPSSAGAVRAIALDRRSLRRARAAHAEHATTLVMNLDSPANDDVPPWVRDVDDLP